MPGNSTIPEEVFRRINSRKSHLWYDAIVSTRIPQRETDDAWRELGTA